jgi:hypothetical protein
MLSALFIQFQLKKYCLVLVTCLEVHKRPGCESELRAARISESPRLKHEAWEWGVRTQPAFDDEAVSYVDIQALDLFTVEHSGISSLRMVTIIPLINSYLRVSLAVLQVVAWLLSVARVSACMSA